MRTLYLECYSGISGDMTVAALLDLGVDENVLRVGLKSLHIDGYRLETGRVKKCGIDAFDFNVILHEHEHHHDHDGHHHGHHHSHDHESHVHRGVKDIHGIIDGSAITDNAKSIAKRAFDIIARAEAKVHGVPVDEVHFHEVGAVDSIVDIVGAAICIDNLGIDRVICTPLREGCGTVKCMHGLMPVPAPATLEIASAHNIPLIITQNDGEMVTPTGAALVAAFAADFAAPSGFRVTKTGYGAGKKDFAVANVLRASIIETEDESGECDEVLEISCNLDDMTGEQLAHACDILMENGALDCWCVPIIMKKGRAAQTLSLLVEPEREREFTRLLFLHTTTIGVRMAVHRRTKMRRVRKTVETGYGPLDIKESSWNDICKTAVEYESANEASNASNAPIIKVYRAGETEAEK